MKSDVPARQKIKNGFLELMEEKNLSAIKVIDIIKVSSISHQTFYRMFLDKYELAESVCYDKLHLIWSVVGKNPTFKEAVVCTLNIIGNNEALFGHLLAEDDGITIIKKVLVSIFKEMTPHELSSMVQLAWINTLIDWCGTGFKTPVEQVYDNLLSSMPVGIVLPAEDKAKYYQAFSDNRIHN
ncbi:MAG: hypothetical protein Q4B73_04340 [Lachnospiraceae bacterium]|nr:hypothetical protein [Lachnospiraceae bacterium]